MLQRKLITQRRKIGVSFILPTYNAAPLLPQTLDSLVNQNWDNKDIIVIDDASTDTSPDILEWYRKKYCPAGWVHTSNRLFEGIQFRVHRNEFRRGTAYCRNWGNKRAFYQVISVCDAGDICHRNKAAAIANNFMKVRPKIDFLAHSATIVDSKLRNLKTQYPKIYKGEEGERPSFVHPAIAYRKKVAEQIQYSGDSLETDLYEKFIIEAKKAGFRFGYDYRSLTMKLELRDDEVYKEPKKLDGTTLSLGRRDILEARRIRRELYKKNNIEVPLHLMAA